METLFIIWQCILQLKTNIGLFITNAVIQFNSFLLILVGVRAKKRFFAHLCYFRKQHWLVFVTDTECVYFAVRATYIKTVVVFTELQELSADICPLPVNSRKLPDIAFSSPHVIQFRRCAQLNASHSFWEQVRTFRIAWSITNDVAVLLYPVFTNMQKKKSLVWLLRETSLILRSVQQHTTNVHQSSCIWLSFFSDFNGKLIYQQICEKIPNTYQISRISFSVSRDVACMWAGGRPETARHITTLTVDFRNFADAFKHQVIRQCRSTRSTFDNHIQNYTKLRHTHFHKRVQKLQILGSDPPPDAHVQREAQLQPAWQMAHRRLLICTTTLIKREPLTRAQW